MDTTGKSKLLDDRRRFRFSIAIFVFGLCVGIGLTSLASGPAQVTVIAAGSPPGALMSQLPSSASQQQAVACLEADEPVYTGEPRNPLEEVLRRVAINREVLAAVSNKNYLWGEPPMIRTFTDGFKRAGVKNHLILALDQETKTWCDNNDVNAHLLELQIHKSQEGTGENHAVSAMKFGILKQFMDIGYSVLLSDVDIAILQNPFDHLYRDSDVEGMTDGFDERTAYGGIDGFDDPSMGWARYAQLYKHFNMNSGLFYLRANKRTTELMRRLDDRLSKQKYWDQTAYNEEIFFLSHGEYKSPQVSVRVMEIDKFMNSKRLFKDVRNRPKVSQPPMPVTVHINYHPDKHERMQAVVKYYIDKDEGPLMAFPGGSEPGSKR